jgi:lysophospholipase L1-like esterase
MITLRSAYVLIATAIVLTGSCSRGTTLRIMPLGDSITFGFTTNKARNPGGYRYYLENMLEETGAKVDFVGTKSRGSADMKDRDHQGMPGWTIRRLAADPVSCHDAWDPDELVGPYKDGIADHYRGFVSRIDSPPDIVLLMIGTNDIIKVTDSVPTLHTRYTALLDTISTVSPEAHIVAANLLPITLRFDSTRCGFGNLNDSVKVVNRRLAETFETAKAKGIDMTVVDMYGIPGIMQTIRRNDGVHPGNKGYRMLARQWFRAIQGVRKSM